MIAIGFFVVVVGFAIIMIGAVLGGGNGNAKVAIGGFIGPIPFGFANDPRMLKVVIAISVAIFALFFLVPLVLRYLR